MSSRANRKRRRRSKHQPKSAGVGKRDWRRVRNRKPDPVGDVITSTPEENKDFESTTYTVKKDD